MREQLVTLETAKLAQDKGYIRIKDISAYDCQFVHTWELCNGKWGIDCFGEAAEETMVAPSQSLLQKWLRDKRKIMIYLQYLPTTMVWMGFVYNKKNMTMRSVLNNDKLSYEQILEQALQAGLKLI